MLSIKRIGCYLRPKIHVFGRNSLNSYRFVHNIRNVGILAHIDAGKTTTTENILYLCGKTDHVGRVDNGDTVMDFLPQEKERGITISAAAITCHWKNHTINIIDTPGHVDFTMEVEVSTRILDGCVLLVDAVSGVQCQTKSVWRRISSRNLPTIGFVNKMDREGADLDQTIESIRHKLGVNPIVLQVPIGQSNQFQGVIDLISSSQFIWSNDPSISKAQHGLPTVIPIQQPDDEYFEICQQMRQQLIESIAELDEEFMEYYLTHEHEYIAPEYLIKALRRICFQRTGLPFFCGSALKGKGIHSLLDGIAAFLPSPTDCYQVNLIQKKTQKIKTMDKQSKEFLALAFKVVHDQMRGLLVYARIFNGQLKSKENIYNASHDVIERTHQILSIEGSDLAPIDSANCGSVVCIGGLRNTRAGDTLISDKSTLKGYQLQGMNIPKPVYSLAIEPESTNKLKDLENALKILSIEDPSLQVDNDDESGQLILRGLGELHLEIIIDKLRRQHKVEVYPGKTYIGYREFLSLEHGNLSLTATFDKILENKRLFAQFDLEIIPIEGYGESKFIIDSQVKDTLTADEYIALEDSLRNCFLRGPKGYPLVGIEVHVKNAIKEAGGLTTPGAIRACIAINLMNTLKEIQQEILEPIMQMEIEIPDEYVGPVMTDLSSKRRAQHVEIQPLQPGYSTIIASVPFQTILGYASQLRSMTRGEGIFSTEYQCHSPVDLHSAQL